MKSTDNLRCLLPLLLATLVATGCSSSTPTPAYSSGTRVILGEDGDPFGVGLWLMYEDTCSVDVTYNHVPGGTHAVITGKVCEDGGVLYYKVSFSSQVREANEITSSNTWVTDSEFAPAP